MYRHSSLSLSHSLRRSMNGMHSVETSTGMFRAIQFVNAVVALPHTFERMEAFHTSESDLQYFVRDDLEHGRLLYEALRDAHRVVFYLDRGPAKVTRMDIPYIQANTLMYTRSGKNPFVTFRVHFSVVFGHLQSMEWLEGNNVHSKVIERCGLCHQAVVRVVNEEITHRLGCPNSFSDQSQHDVFNLGYADGFHGRENRRAGMVYELGYHMGESSYMAEVISGLQSGIR